MIYWLPGQSRLFSTPLVLETKYSEELEKAVNLAHEHGYEIVKVERVEE